MSLSVGKSDEWYTPPAIFAALKLQFDLDPCSPGQGHWVPATQVYTKIQNGLAMPWFGSVFCNPPMGGRCGQVPWVQKFIAHGDGIAIVFAMTSANWFHEHAIKADAILFPRDKTKFIKPDGKRGDKPWYGIALLACGQKCETALRNSNLGWCP